MSGNNIAGQKIIKKDILQKYSYIHNLEFKILERALVILRLFKEEFGTPWTQPETIAEILVETFHLPADSLSIKRAFSKAGGSRKERKPVISKLDQNSLSYKISQPGEDYLESVRGRGLLEVLYLEPQSHRGAREELGTLVRRLKGKELRICDPYYGLGSLNVLEEILRTNKKIKFLSHETKENVLKFKAELNYLKRHYPNKFEMKIYPKRELHDRYILAENAFVIIGQGIKDLGNKESLVIVIDDRFGKDTKRELEKAFSSRWSTSSNI